MKIIRSFLSLSLLSLLFSSLIFAQQNGRINGEVVDSLGDAVVGATVVVVDSNGVEKKATTNNRGRFVVNGLVPGKYTVKISAESFAVYENTEVQVTTGRSKPLKVVLSIEAVTENVDVNDEGQVSTDAANNATALVLKGDELDALPDDPDDLETALQALAGGGAGPNGGQIYIDGFEGGNLPPKEAIREIRINRDPFSAEFDRLGYGRIEILTKPGATKWTGNLSFNFNDDAFNSRNPFSENKADSQRQFYRGYISGPIVKNKASFSLSGRYRDTKNGSSVNATILDPSFNITTLNQEFSLPSKFYSINPRFDYQLNDNNTLVARYEYERRTADNRGIGGFTLPSRATEFTNTEHTLQLTETAIINAKTVNETRFQYRFEDSQRTGDNSIPTINVSGAFNAGGSSLGLSFDKVRSWELQNYTTTSLGKNSEHGVKFGVRIRGRTLEDRSDSNYNGTFTFTGFIPNGPNIYDLDGDGIVSSIEQYRAKVLGDNDPLYNPRQYSVTTGEPLADISQYDVGLFIKDDWTVNKKLSLSYGLRYENQTNINDSLNFAPRFSFGFSPGAGGATPPKTVLRGGVGIFYSRFNANNSLQALRLDGTRQQQYIVTGNDALLGQPVFTLDGVTNVPTIAQLANITPLSSTPRIVADGLQAPYTIQGAFSFERQLPARSTLSIYYVYSRSLHLIRSRNINAPVCPTGAACPTNDANALQALRPDPTQGNIYQYESSGVATDQRLIFSFRTFFSSKLMLFSNYIIGRSKSNSDGGFPSYSYDTSADYGNSIRDRRQFFFLGGSIGVPFGISLRPFVLAGSGTPFNITTGTDANGDSIFNDRPTFGELANACNLSGLNTSWCDVGGEDPNAIIPRNYGRGPSFFTINMGIDRNFGFGTVKSGGDNRANQQGRRGRRGRGGNVFGGGRRGGFSRGGERKPYNLSVGLRIYNLLNTNNQNTPVGNINSPLFGESTSTAGFFGRGGSAGGNRRVELRLRFRW